MLRFVLLSGKTVAPCGANDCGCGCGSSGIRLGTVCLSVSHRKHSSKQIVRSIRDKVSLASSCLSGGEWCELRERVRSVPAYRHGMVVTQMIFLFKIQTKINDLAL